MISSHSSLSLLGMMEWIFYDLRKHKKISSIKFNNRDIRSKLKNITLCLFKKVSSKLWKKEICAYIVESKSHSLATRLEKIQFH